MRQYLLTDKEREIISKFLEDGTRLEGFKVLLHRCRHMQTVKEDSKIIEHFLKKAIA